MATNIPLQARFPHLLEIMSSPRFLKMEGLGNEVPFFICSVDPKEATEIRQVVDNLVTHLSRAGIAVLSIDLYDLTIELLQQRGIFQQVLEIEPTLSKDEMTELLQNVLDPEKHLVPAIEKKMGNSEFQILFITGVGEVYPYIRSHNVLNNLQRAAKTHPTVMFFPGEYTYSLEGGATLSLFGEPRDDKYYRAFNIDHYHL